MSGLGGISVSRYVCVADGRVGGAHSGACGVRGEGGSDVHIVDCLLVCCRTGL